MNVQNRKILVVSPDKPFAQETVRFSIQIAKRLGYDLIALKVKTVGHETEIEGKRFKAQAAQEQIPCEFTCRTGDFAETVEAFQHQAKRVEFVLTGFEEEKEELTGIVTVPVFSIMSDPLPEKRRGIMAAQQKSRMKMLAKTVGLGLLTAGLYAAVFMNAKTVMQYFTKGSWYAALPIATVFVFSLAHGAFAGNLWSLLGINAMKKGEVHQTVQKAVRVGQRSRKRPRVYAYVNPFHRL